MVKLSIVIVAYRNMECLVRCLASIPLFPWIEVLVVNNSRQNRGYGAGCNLGARHASGEYVLFLNPDCVVNAKGLTRIVSILDKDKTIGILGPRLVDENKKPYLSCNRPLSRLTAPFVYSFLNRLLAKLPLVRQYWYENVPPSTQTVVGSVCGAAMAMRKSVFNTIRGFDEQFFLFWEEFDLAIRVTQQNYRVVFDPTVTFVHEGGQSTLQSRSQVMRWFRESRYHFFRKHTGIIYATFLEAWLTFSEEWRAVVAVVATLGFGFWFYGYGWWLSLAHLSFWERWVEVGLRHLQFNYWLGVVGAIFLMTMVYNELKFARWAVVLTTVMVGMWAVVVSVFGPVLFLLGAMWMVVDLQKGVLWLRKGLVMVGLSGLCVVSGLLVKDYLSVRGFSASLVEWVPVSQLLIRSGKPISLHCIGCLSPRELLPLRWMLEEQGVTMDTTSQNVVYLLLPPYSLSDGLVPDAITIKTGSMALAWPLDYP